MTSWTEQCCSHFGKIADAVGANSNAPLPTLGSPSPTPGPAAPWLTTITRWDIFVPVSVAEMKEEAVKDIDPLLVPPVQPSWKMDGDALTYDKDPGHFLARKMIDINKSSTPSLYRKFDTRLYFQHPLAIHQYPFPCGFLPPLPPTIPPADDLACSDAPAAGPAAGPVTKPLWYNQKPSVKVPIRVPLMGRPNPVLTRNLDFQMLLTAVNKRLVRLWMGELKYYVNAAEDRARLASWFGTGEGRKHFSQWCQALGVQYGDRDSGRPNSAHLVTGEITNGKAIDINYDHNPWIPLCSGDGTMMLGETPLNQDGFSPQLTQKQLFDACGRIYDRALRLFVPLVTSDPGDPNGTRHFSSTYYRIHYDWTSQPEVANLRSAEQVYAFYQILNWSLRFYFDYLYGQCSVPLTDKNFYSDHPLPPLKSESERALEIARRESIWKRIEQDWIDGKLPPSAEVHITNLAFIPEAARELFEKIKMTYSFQEPEAVEVFRLRLAENGIRSDAERAGVAAAVTKQIEYDHKMLSRGMVYGAPTTRDPCNGVFNHSFEVALAFCYMLKEPDVRRLRAFGAFANLEGGDMQHFDFGHSVRQIPPQ